MHCSVFPQLPSANNNQSNLTKETSALNLVPEAVLCATLTAGVYYLTPPQVMEGMRCPLGDCTG